VVGEEVDGLLGPKDDRGTNNANEFNKVGSSRNRSCGDVVFAEGVGLVGDDDLAGQREVLAVGYLGEGVPGHEELDALGLGTAHDVRVDGSEADHDLEVKGHGVRDFVLGEGGHGVEGALHRQARSVDGLEVALGVVVRGRGVWDCWWRERFVADEEGRAV
jgi:hypothetical protein